MSNVFNHFRNTPSSKFVPNLLLTCALIWTNMLTIKAEHGKWSQSQTSKQTWELPLWEYQPGQNAPLCAKMFVPHWWVHPCRQCPLSSGSLGRQGPSSWHTQIPQQQSWGGDPIRGKNMVRFDCLYATDMNNHETVNLSTMPKHNEIIEMKSAVSIPSSQLVRGW